MVIATPSLWPIKRLVSQAVPSLGILTGVELTGGVLVFAGIRYAEPPVGKQRWRPPVPFMQMTTEDLNALAFGPACPQINGGDFTGEEDCLYLNVFAPLNSSRLSPVMVFFHGGSYVKGSVNPGLNSTWAPMYDGRALAARGVLVVTLQYRLGVFGFLGGDDLRARAPDGSTGSYGIQDQRLALHWVQRHIRSFGGDTSRVTIFGESAGAGCVHWHVVANTSRGLFTKAVLESGANGYWIASEFKDTQARFERILASMQCENITCLEQLPARSLVLAAAQEDWAPTVDGVELERPPWVLVERQALNPSVPLLVGINRDEGSGSGPVNASRANFEALLASHAVPKGSRARLTAQYAALHSEWYWASVAFKTDYSYACPALRFVRAASSAGIPLWAYHSSLKPSFPVELLYGPSGIAQQQWGAYHGSELPYVFGNAVLPAWRVKLNEEEQRVAFATSRDWVHFAANGRPSRSWPQHTPTNSVWLLLGSNGITFDERRLLPLCDTIDALGNLGPWR
mmetsp:Transcript_32388/g.53613  ORF Transcript_32388/g.53613 Transcript_32388/m.53613 type:complete len:513 (+) Transcript_32388:149-1687(+)